MVWHFDFNIQSDHARLKRSEGFYMSDWILVPQFKAPSQSLDWQGAARPTGGAFVATSGSLGICSSASMLDSCGNALARVCVRSTSE